MDSVHSEDFSSSLSKAANKAVNCAILKVAKATLYS